MKLLRNALILSFFLAVGAGCAKTSNDSSGTTAAATNTCASGYLYSATYGCQLACGTAAIWVNNQCVSTTATATTTTTVGATCATGYVYSSYYGQCIANTATTTTVTTTTNVCQSFCPSGYVAVGQSCLPQYACGACYGYYAGGCYIGNGAYSYYGYY